MAATAAVEDPATPAENWPQDDQISGSGASEQAANGASLAVEGHDSEQPQDYPRAPSTSATETTFREKQVKVLRSF